MNRSRMPLRMTGLALACLLGAAGASAEVVLKPRAAPEAAADADAEPDAQTVRITGATRRQLAALARQADTGNVAAMLQLGLVYYEGKSVGRSYAEAYRRFEQAASGGDARAALAAGYLLARGWGIARNPADARAWFGIAGQAGYPRGFYLQSLLEDQIGTPQGRMAARDLLERAAAAGDPVAANALGVSYEHAGQAATARLWYQQAASEGSRSAAHNLERLGAAAASNQQRDDALRRLREASAAGNADATYELATRYHRGDGVPVDYGEAVRLYRLAAREGSAEAQRMLSLILSRSTSAEPISPAWMLELSRLAQPPRDTAQAVDATALDDPLDGLFELQPQAPAAAGTASIARTTTSAAAVGIGVAAPAVAPVATAPIAAPSNADALSRARRLRARDGNP